MSFSSSIMGSEQLSLEDALVAVREAADEKWYAAALERIRHLCLTRASWSADDIWEGLDGLDLSTREPRALGAVLRDACSKGWCVPSGSYQKTSRPEAHRRPVAIWRSLLIPSEQRA